MSMPHVRRRSVPRKWRTRLAPRPRNPKPKGLPTLWKRVRRFLLSWWVWAALGVYATAADAWIWAAVAGLLAFVCFLITPAEQAPRYGLDHEFGVTDPDFIPTMTGATDVALSDGNRIDVLNNGREFYPAMLDAIRRAEASITIEAYIYWAGDIGLEFARAISARSAAGVQVKLLLDTVGSATIGQQILEILEAGHCQLAWYNPVRWYSLERFNHRTHRKSLIIDGRQAFTGGAGIADHWQGNAEDPDHWRDIQIHVQGPCVVPLQSGFAHNWVQTTGELISGEAFYPAITPAGDLRAMTIMSSPEVGASTVRTLYYLSIACARESIYIANPYFVPDETAIEALIEAKRRGVDVRIMVAGIHNDNWVARRNSVRLYGPLLRADIPVLEYNRTMMHQKTMVVDGVWSTVGTTNFDNRSFSHNDENNVCVYDRTWAKALQDIFIADEPACDRVTLDAWRRRGLGERLGGFVASFLEEQS
jgi:cardiolipin synthase